jgi:hypothetical protein
VFASELLDLGDVVRSTGQVLPRAFGWREHVVRLTSWPQLLTTNYSSFMNFLAANPPNLRGSKSGETLGSIIVADPWTTPQENSQNTNKRTI